MTRPFASDVLRVGFAGSPGFAAEQLKALLAQQVALGIELVCVFTQPDRPAGRGLAMQACAVKQVAESAGLPVHAPQSLRAGQPGADEACAALAAARLDVLVVVAYGLLLPQPVLDLPRWGCINLHASLLPRWRGAAPIQRALAAGDAETGICVMQMEAGLDTGPIWSTHRLSIAPDDTVASLHDRLASLGTEALSEWFRMRPFLAGPPSPQPNEGSCYAPKITAQDRPAQLAEPAERVACQIRSLDPSPGSTVSWQGVTLKCGAALVVERHGQWAAPGTILKLPTPTQPFLSVACGTGVVGLGWFQRPGGKRLSAPEFSKGAGWAVGALLAVVS